MTLPERFSDLSPLLDDWSTADPSRRVETLLAASPAQLHDLVARVLPLVPAIEEYLNSLGDAPFEETALRLLRLAEAALDAGHELRARGVTDADEG